MYPYMKRYTRTIVLCTPDTLLCFFELTHKCVIDTLILNSVCTFTLAHATMQRSALNPSCREQTSASCMQTTIQEERKKRSRRRRRRRRRRSDCVIFSWNTSQANWACMIHLQAPIHYQTQSYDKAATHIRYAVSLIRSTEFLQQTIGSYDCRVLSESIVRPDQLLQEWTNEISYRTRNSAQQYD